MPFGKKKDLSGPGTGSPKRKSTRVSRRAAAPANEDDWDVDRPSEAAGEDISRKAGRKVRSATEQFDVLLDQTMTRTIEDGPQIVKERLSGMAEDTRTKIQTIDTTSDRYSDKLLDVNFLDRFTDIITQYPKMVVVGVTFLVIFLTLVGVIGVPPDPDFYGIPPDLQKTKLKQSLRGDFEVYLPQGDETQKILNQVQQNWSTDLIMLYVQSVNAFDPSSNVSVTDLSVLRELDAMEQELDFNVGDEGEEDGIVWMFSLPMLIKMLNATPANVANAFTSEFGLNSLPVYTDYSLPNDQQTIDTLVTQMSKQTGSMGSLWVDTNNDMVMDTTIVLIGLSSGSDMNAILDRIYLPKRTMGDHPNPPGLVDDYYVVSNADKDSYFTESNWWQRVHEGKIHCRITPTGPTPLTKTLTDRTYSELMKVLPAAVFLVATALLFYHRTWKITIIAGMPVLFSLMTTFAVLGLSGMTLTPQVTMMAPILIALGVAYGLYIANRYIEEKNEPDKKERIKVAVRTTGKAVFLSAVTTSIGFGSLMGMNMIPLQVLGFGLSSGIMISWAMTMVMCPALIVMLDYTKPITERVNDGEGMATKLGRFPVNHRKKIIAVSITAVLLSLLALTTISSNMDFMALSPQDEPVVVASRKISDEFGGGQIGMVLVDGQPVRSNRDVDYSMKDFTSLKQIKHFEDDVNTIDNTEALGLMDIMVMIKIPEFRENNTYWNALMDRIPASNLTDRQIIEDIADKMVGSSFYDAMDLLEGSGGINVMFKAYYNEDLSTAFMNIFYESIGPAVRAMMVSSDYSRTLVYINMPNMDVVKTKAAVSAVNEVTQQNYPGLTLSKLTGFGAIVVVVNDILMVNSVMSTVLALSLVFAVLALTFFFTEGRGVGDAVKTALVTLLPVLGVIFWQFGVLYLIGIVGDLIDPANPPFSGDLNLFTAMIGSIMVGIGIDFCIHITERVHEGGRDRNAIQYAVSTSGMSFIESTSTMIMGLSAVFLINIPAIREFILLVMLLLILSAAGAILLLPAIYTVIFDIRDRKKVKGATRIIDTVRVEK